MPLSWWSAKAVEEPVIPFFEKTWFVWWILATLVILHWFHRFASRADERAPEAADSIKEVAFTSSEPIPSGTASSLSI